MNYDPKAAARILNRSMAMFADEDGISVGAQFRGIPGTEKLSLALTVAEDGDFRLTIFGFEESPPPPDLAAMGVLPSTCVVTRFQADGDLTSTKPPKVTQFDRGPWERQVLALDA
jgi:hypothetical protein